jgi:hypothetical protein
LNNDDTILDDQSHPSKSASLKTGIKHAGDRRICVRLPTLIILTHVKVCSAEPSTADWIAVKMLDYSHNGFAFLSHNEFKVAQTLKVCIRLDIDRTEVSLTDVIAKVRSVSLDNGGLRYGAEFNFEANNHMRSPRTKAKLSGIERMVNRALKAMASG